jgi:hypothetical protein
MVKLSAANWATTAMKFNIKRLGFKIDSGWNLKWVNSGYLPALLCG